MTIEEANKRLEDIKHQVEDDERAHSMEDDFYKDVLLSIIKDPTNSIELAKIALKTKDLDFARWCA